MQIGLSQQIDFKDQSKAKDEIDTIMNNSVNSQWEGLFIKKTGKDTFYDLSGSRTQWIKYKAGSVSQDLGDTLDLIPVAGFYGKGKRTGLFGSYLL